MSSALCDSGLRGLALPGARWGRGRARRAGMAWPGKARRDSFKFVAGRCGARRGGPGRARRGIQAGQGGICLLFSAGSLARRGAVRMGRAWHGMAWHGMAGRELKKAAMTRCHRESIYPKSVNEFRSETVSALSHDHTATKTVEATFGWSWAAMMKPTSALKPSGRTKVYANEADRSRCRAQQHRPRPTAHTTRFAPRSS